MKAILYQKSGPVGIKPVILDSDELKKNFYFRLTNPGSVILLSDQEKEAEKILADKYSFRKMDDKTPKLELFRALKLEKQVLHRVPRYIFCYYPDAGAFRRSFITFFNKRYMAGMPPCILFIPAAIFQEMVIDKNRKELRESNAKSVPFPEPFIRKWLDKMEKNNDMVQIVSDFPGTSRAASLVRALIWKASSVKLPVLLMGETGTEKNRIAALIHKYSADPTKAFVYVSCGAITDLQFEAEFFGQVSGTGSNSGSFKKGFFMKAYGGTLFLDEIGDLSMTNQARLLYTLETGTYYPVGSIESRKCNFRIITATHSNLPLKVRLKSFREDLYYRLSSIQIVLSPLRERAEDIPVIANLFWKEINPLHADLNEEFLAYLMKRSWPGNVRELRMVLESMAAIYNDHIPSKECVESLRKLRNDQGLFQRDELRDYYQPLQHEYLNRLAKTLQIIRKIRVLLRPLINSEESVIHNQQEIQNIRVNVDIQNNILSTFLLDPLSFKDPELFDLIRVFRYDLDEALKKLLTTADTFAAIWKSQFEEPYHEILHIIFKLVWPNDGSKHSYSDENDFLKNN